MGVLDHSIIDPGRGHPHSKRGYRRCDECDMDWGVGGLGCCSGIGGRAIAVENEGANLL